jgi:DNA primase
MCAKNLKILTPQEYNRRLPKEIEHWLLSKGINKKVINENLLGWKYDSNWNNYCITIPIFNKEKNLLFYKYRQNPLEPNEETAKYWYDSGSKTSLYGIHLKLTLNSNYVVFCEGEIDTLVLNSFNIPSITSTGGATSFQNSWNTQLKQFNPVYICLDNDKAGFHGTIKLKNNLANSIPVTLPSDIPYKGDTSDYFSKFNHSTDDFLYLLKTAKINYFIENNSNKPKKPVIHQTKRQESNELLSKTPIILIAESLGIRINKYTNPPMALCPFHEDKHASLAFYPNGFYCFGCQTKGNSVELVKLYKNCSVKEAIKYILSI